MKILLLNCPSLDLSYFSTRGLPFEMEYQPLSKVFAEKFLYTNTTEQGESVPLYTPDVLGYLKTVKTDADFILVGWNPADYGVGFKYTGGYSCPNALPNGAYFATIRIDQNSSSYAVHELHHLLCDKLIFSLGQIGKVHDYMDLTPSGGTFKPYFLNGSPDDPSSNHALTWATIAPYIGILTRPTVTITRFRSNIHETLGNLVAKYNGMTFTCKTLELADWQNQKDISCIPKGQYVCSYTYSLRFWRNTYKVRNVPKRSGVRIHPTNFYYELNGCIALGSDLVDINNDQELDSINSKATIKAFETFMGRKEFLLIIN